MTTPLTELRTALDQLEHDDPRLTAMLDLLRTRRPALRFELFGGFRVKRGGAQIDDSAWQRPMASRVVRFLLMQGGACVPEDALFEAFWPDRDAHSARQHLAQAISRARKVLDLPGAEQSLIEARERTFRLRLDETDSLDTSEFEAAAADALANHGSGRRAALETAAALWSGELLPEDRYAGWAFIWREHLIEKYVHVLSALVDCHEDAGDHHKVVRVGRRLLELDPLDEHAHRQLMTAYASSGRRSLALRQFLECRKALVEELGIEPSAATRELQESVLSGSPCVALAA